MEIGAKLFYKCQFEVELSDPERDDDVLWLIMHDLGVWMGSKRYTMLDGRQRLTYAKIGTSLREHRNRASFHSAFHENEDYLEWAGVLEEEEPPQHIDGTNLSYSPRKWVTELSYKAADVKSRGVFSLILSYQDRPGFLGPDKPDPHPSVPRLIRMLTNDDRLYCSKSGFSLERMLTMVGAEGHVGTLGAASLWKLVMQQDREYPIIYIGCSDDGNRLAVDPVKLSESLHPNALICYPRNSDEDGYVQRMCPLPALRCARGSIRVYATRPKLVGPEAYRDLRKHRYFSVADIARIRENRSDDGQDPMIVLLRQALAQDVHFYEEKDFVPLDKVRQDLREEGYKREIAEADERIDSYHTELEKLRAGIRMTHEETAETAADEKNDNADELRRRLEASEKDVIEALRIAEKYEIELKEMKSKAYAQSVTIDSLRHSNDSDRERRRIREIREALPADLSSYFSSTSSEATETDSDILGLFEALYSDRIVVSDQARKGLKDCVTKPGVFWQAMSLVATNLWESYMQEGGGNVDDRFNASPGLLPGFTVALTEGTMTHRDNKLMALRNLRVGDRDYVIEPHLKRGNKDDADSIRVYYAWDSDSSRIIIGHIGKHLTNYTTKKGIH